MMPHVPDYLVALETPFQAAQTVIGLGLVWMGAARMQAPARTRYATAGAIALAFVAWQAMAQYLGSANAYLSGPMFILPLSLVAPLTIGTLGLLLSGRVSSLVSSIPLPMIVLAQVYRVGGGIFLVLWADGQLPWQFALPAGVGDVATGIGAVVISVMLARNAAAAYRAAYIWCFFGIADLVVAIVTGAMTSPGPLHLLALEAPNLLVTAYPLVMVPTFAVPLALLLHGTMLWRLQRPKSSTGRLALA
jgi:hypothetical protein